MTFISPHFWAKCESRKAAVAVAAAALMLTRNRSKRALVMRLHAMESIPTGLLSLMWEISPLKTKEAHQFCTYIVFALIKRMQILPLCIPLGLLRGNLHWNWIQGTASLVMIFTENNVILCRKKQQLLWRKGESVWFQQALHVEIDRV